MCLKLIKEDAADGCNTEDLWARGRRGMMFQWMHFPKIQSVFARRLSLLEGSLTPGWSRDVPGVHNSPRETSVLTTSVFVAFQQIVISTLYCIWKRMVWSICSCSAELMVSVAAKTSFFLYLTCFDLTTRCYPGVFVLCCSPGTEIRLAAGNVWHINCHDLPRLDCFKKWHHTIDFSGIVALLYGSVSSISKYHCCFTLLVFFFRISQPSDLRPLNFLSYSVIYSACILIFLQDMLTAHKMFGKRISPFNSITKPM